MLQHGGAFFCPGQLGFAVPVKESPEGFQDLNWRALVLSSSLFVSRQLAKRETAAGRDLLTGIGVKPGGGVDLRRDLRGGTFPHVPPLRHSPAPTQEPLNFWLACCLSPTVISTHGHCCTS